MLLAASPRHWPLGPSLPVLQALGELLEHQRGRVLFEVKKVKRGGWRLPNGRVTGRAMVHGGHWPGLTHLPRAWVTCFF